MSYSSTSVSNPTPGGWARLRRLGLIVLALLVGLELFFRLPITQPLEPYEDLLWYDVYPPAYSRALRSGAHHDLWLLGSSYMMTGLNPALIQQELGAAGLEAPTVQNYGLNTLQNLEVMGEFFDRWLFRLDEPDTVVLAIAAGNFWPVPRENLKISNSPLESIVIFPDSLEDHVAGFLFRHSALFHTGLLLRNIVDVRDPQTQAALMNQTLPLGGYVENGTVYAPPTCDLSTYDAPLEAQIVAPDAATIRQDFGSPQLGEMDTFIQVIRQRGLPLAIVIIPDQACEIATLYGSYANYRAMLVDPVLDHLQSQGLPILDLNPLFQAAVPAQEQPNYYANHNHPNTAGAALFSQWTGEWLADWLGETGAASPAVPDAF